LGTEGRRGGKGDKRGWEKGNEKVEGRDPLHFRT